MKTFLSSLEIAAIVQELQPLVQGRLAKIYVSQEVLLQIHKADQPKALLKVIPGKGLCLTALKEAPQVPSGFSLQLRKYIENASIKKIYQYQSERIVVFELEKKVKYNLIIELFSKGNVILTANNYTIIAVAEKQIWKDRTVAASEKYVFPSSMNWKEVSEKGLTKIFAQSTRKNLATSLAMDMGLGGVYAEEICTRAGLDKDKIPTQISAQEIKLIVKTLSELIKLIQKPQGFAYAEQITPFELQGQQSIKKYDSYNHAVDTIRWFEKPSPYQQKILSLQKIIALQQESVEKQQRLIEENSAKAESIYRHYQPISTLLEIVRELRRTKEWSEVENELRKEKKIVNVDLKNKKIALDL